MPLHIHHSLFWSSKQQPHQHKDWPKLQDASVGLYTLLQPPKLSILAMGCAYTGFLGQTQTHPISTVPCSPSSSSPTCAQGFIGREDKHQRPLQVPSRSQFGKTGKRQRPQDTIPCIQRTIWKPFSCLCAKFGCVHLRLCMPGNRALLRWEKKTHHIKLAVWFEVKPQIRQHKCLRASKGLNGFHPHVQVNCQSLFLVPSLHSSFLLKAAWSFD